MVKDEKYGADLIGLLGRLNGIINMKPATPMKRAISCDWLNNE